MKPTPDKSSVETTLGVRLASPRLIFGVAGVFCALALLMNHFGPGPFIFNQMVSPFNFYVRELLGREPELDPRIKILSLDDSTASWMRSSALTNKQWVALLSALDRQRPQLILVDKVFRLPDGAKSSPRDLANMQRAMAKMRTRRVAGAFVAPRAIKNDEPLKFLNSTLDLNTYVSPTAGAAAAAASEIQNPHLRWLKPEDGQLAYGPFGIMRRAFSALGHLHYSADGWMQSFVPIDDQHVLPHISFYALEKPKILPDAIEAKNQQIPIDARGRILINFSKAADYWQRSLSLKPFLLNALRGDALPGIERQDVVVIAPLMYTGNTDFKLTPLGHLPGAFSHVAVLNSVLTKNWLSQLKYADVYAAGFILVATAIGYLLNPLLALFGVVGFALAYAVAHLVLFTHLGIFSNWLIPALAGAVAGLTVIMIKLYRERHRALTLRSTLDGMIPRQNLNQLVHKMTPLNFDAREHVITVMFVDVVGYSLLAENQIPRVAFNHLRQLLKDVTHQVHQHGGIVNKTLGDGLLCLFGYDFVDKRVVSDHAEKAVLCAIKIQTQNIKQNLKAFMQGDPVYPLRIGIHTASVFLGNLGIGDRLDFTAVGNGVNFAKRLEGACEMHCVMFSSTTKDLAASLALNPAGLSKRLISIKHHTGQIEAYEYDPIHDHPDQRTKALEAYRQCASLARMEQRFSVNHPEYFTITSTAGDGVLINYSSAGMSIKLKSMMMKGSTLVIKLDSPDGLLAEQIKDLGIKELRGEVRWVYSESDGHVHGLFFRDLSDKTSAQLIELIKKFDFGVPRSNISRIGPLAS